MTCPECGESVRTSCDSCSLCNACRGTDRGREMCETLADEAERGDRFLQGFALDD